MHETYSTGEIPRTGDLVEHLVDGDRGGVRTINGEEGDRRIYLSVKWQKDGLATCYPDEVKLIERCK